MGQITSGKDVNKCRAAEWQDYPIFLPVVKESPLQTCQGVIQL